MKRCMNHDTNVESNDYASRQQSKCKNNVYKLTPHYICPLLWQDKNQVWPDLICDRKIIPWNV